MRIGAFYELDKKKLLNKESNKNEISSFLLQLKRVILYTQVFMNSIGMAGKLC